MIERDRYHQIPSCLIATRTGLQKESYLVEGALQVLFIPGENSLFPGFVGFGAV
jgi:hypothetical protein